MSFAEIILVGNVGRDPELRFTPNGNAVCDFSLAVNRRRPSGDNNWVEETTWFKISVWGRQAETVNKYVQKGRQVMVVGDRIEANAYTSRDGEARASLDVTARRVVFLSGGSSDGGGSRGGGYDDYDNYDGGGATDADDIPF